MTHSVEIPAVASAPPTSSNPTRRAMLAGALGGIGAWVASAIGRPAVTRAGVDGDVVLGSTLNFPTLETGLSNQLNNNNVFSAQTDGSGTALGGSSQSGIGVQGTSNASNQPAVAGQSYGNRTGVVGFSGGGLYASKDKTGVYGFADQDSNAAGVWGYSGIGTGVIGSSDSHTGGYGFSGPFGTQPAAKARTGVYGYANQTSGAVGVWGESSIGLGVYGKTATGYAGYFNGKVFSNAFYELGEIATPAAPVANRARLFVRDTGLGKTQLCVRFNTGVVKVLATEP